MSVQVRVLIALPLGCITLGSGGADVDGHEKNTQQSDEQFFHYGLLFDVVHRIIT